ncbi:bacteriocin [Pseudoxanthobacter sp.]|uniref:bacteriocin n=1 Tax=Pseudoxanthobacter sp. TaxID=1925742 RepID=UPI002FDF558B
MRKILVPVVLVMLTAACTQQQTNRALVGGAVGAGLGAVTGAAISGNTGGALTGAAIGGVGGAAVGAATAR